MLIENGLIGIRIMADRDIEDFYQYRKHPDVCRFQGFKPMGLEDCRNLIKDMNIGLNMVNGNWLQLAICMIQNDRMIGDCGYKIGKVQNHIADIGYTIAPNFQNRGFGTQAVSLLCTYLFQEIGLQKIVANIDPRNISSARVLQKLDFTLETTTEGTYWDKYDEKYVDEHFYALFKTE